MAKVVVLGGCGKVGRVAVKTLAGLDEFEKIIIADINLKSARKLAKEINPDRVTSIKVDADNIKSINRAIKDADIVLNCTGPFYLYEEKILNAVINSGKNYVDVCDDVDVTLKIFNLDKKAKKKGITALIGMGSSPGVTNLLAKYASDNLLDEVEAVDIYHAHGGEPEEGEGVIAHRFHCMSIDVPQFIDGELKMVKFFDDSGISLREEVDFYKLGDKIKVYPYPHPEQVTIPKFIKVKRVTNKGTVLPEEYYNLIMKVCELGLHKHELLNVKGKKISKYDFSIAFLLQERERILKETNFGKQRGCVKVVVTGKKNGKSHKYIFSMASQGQALGEGTGIPAAMGVILMNRGKIKEKGVLPPEGCVNPLDFISLIGEIVRPEKDKKSFEGLVIDSIDENGSTTRTIL